MSNMSNQDIERKIRMAYCGFGITLDVFNAMNIYDKAYFFWKGELISRINEGKAFVIVRKLDTFYIECRTLNGKDCEYKACNSIEELKPPKIAVKKASLTEEEMDKRIIVRFQKQQRAYSERWANRGTTDFNDDLPF